MARRTAKMRHEALAPPVIAPAAWPTTMGTLIRAEPAGRAAIEPPTEELPAAAPATSAAATRRKVAAVAWLLLAAALLAIGLLAV